MSSSSSSSSSSRPCANGAAGLYQFYEDPSASSAIPQNCMKDIGLWTGADVGSWLRWLKFSRTTTTLDGPGLLQVVATNGGNIYKPGEVDPYWSRLTDRERILLKQAIMPFMPGALSPGPEEAVDQEPSAPSTPPGAAASSTSAAGGRKGASSRSPNKKRPPSSAKRRSRSTVGKDDLEQGIKVSLGTRTPTDALVLKAIEGPLVGSGRASSSSSDSHQLHSGSILLTKGERVTGGRHSGQNKIVVPESFVSRKHFAIWNGVYLMDEAHTQDPFACGRDPLEEQASPWRVQDLGSTTGTFLMVRDQARLADGMAFQLGATEVHVWVVETARLEEMFGSLGNQLQHRGAEGREPPPEELTEDEELEIFQTALSTLQGVGTSSSSSSAVTTSSSAQAPEGKRETEQRRAQTTLLLSFQTSSDVSIAGSFRLANCAESAGTITTVTGRVIENLRPDRTAYLASASSKKTEISPEAVDLSPAKITVGRDATNVVSVADMQLSTFHASISSSFTGPGGGSFVVTDRYSTNRTWIRLSPDGEASPPFAFRLGDVLKVGSSLFMPFDPKDVGLEAEVLAASAARDGDGPLHSELQALVEESEQEMRMAASGEPAAALTSEHPYQDDKRDAAPAASASEMQQAQAALQRAIESELRAKNDEDFDQGFAAVDAVTSISSSLNGTTRMRDLNGRVEFAITSEQWHLEQQAREQQRLWDTATSSLATFNSFRETGAASSSSANGDGRPRHHTTPSGTSGSSPPRPPRPPPAADLADPSGLLAPSPPRKRFADYSGGAASSGGSNYYGCALRNALPNVILSADAYAAQLLEVRREHVERDPGYEERGTIVAAAEEDEEAVAPQEEVGQTGVQSAASSSASTRPTAKVETTYVKLQKREDENLCKICFDGELNCCLYPCGHVVCCVECSKKINECPVCRQFIGEVIKLFRV